jgi:uncharacterized Zn-finger protein
LVHNAFVYAPWILDAGVKMSPNRLLSSQRFNYGAIAVLVVCVASAVLGIFLLTRFDTLIHGQLYSFGLQYDPAWADLYYYYMQLMYIVIGVPMLLSLFCIALSFKRSVDKQPEPSLTQKPRLAQPQRQPVVCEERKAKVQESNNIVISCPKCKKMFGRPLVMLNFDAGKNRLMNVCPYCSHVLGSAENEQAYKSDFQIADADKKLEH